MDSPLVTDVRGRGLFIGVEVDPARTNARTVVDRLLARGILSKDTHGTVIRIAPPLNVPREALVWAVGEIRAALGDVERGVRREAWSATSPDCLTHRAPPIDPAGLRRSAAFRPPAVAGCRGKAAMWLTP